MRVLIRSLIECTLSVSAGSPWYARCNAEGMSKSDPVRTPIAGVVAMNGAGEVRRLTVACPKRRHVVPFETCVDCDQLRKVTFPDDGRLFVLCDIEPPAPVPRDARLAQVFDVMSADVTCAQPTMHTDQLVVVMERRGLTAVPVVDVAGKPIGIVTRADVVRLDHFLATTESAFDPNYTPPRPRPLFAREVMTPVELKLRQNESLAHAAKAMAESHAHYAPVVDDDGRVVGIISAVDILNWLGAAERPSE